MNAIDAAIAVASSHGLQLTSGGATLIEAGLDYRIVMAQDRDGCRWVLRLPRRADVSESIAAENRILELVAPVLAAAGVAVPDWQVRSPDVIAYPALPGAPGLTLTDDGEPDWHMDAASPDYAVRLGRLLARLHCITAEQAKAAGVQVRTPARVRQSWRDDIENVRAAFTVAPELSEAWDSWLADDSCWPDETVMTHGEIYPAHLLFAEDGSVTGVLDWTTARVDDPARDLAAQYGAAGEDMLEVTLGAYAAAGGHPYPGLAAQARHLWEASPIGYALYALTTRAQDDLAVAAKRLQMHA
ncbi:macrolide 2'-phosphotransferase [Mycobacterium yunnanensis]|uniref:Macrolide 2'-phosphotransferase n=1 Tax=Mycobacterium yunnanensis TaxID=368477 RepID=A0A9X2Z043_9MYCO|nr:macrolide 2'-phosphotransferase [Mycobacterium yunnanensis]MCV7420534.1 macrolide 2'-phosphotransferase [Mycobacterium yunnanensis]